MPVLRRAEETPAASKKEPLPSPSSHPHCYGGASGDRAIAFDPVSARMLKPGHDEFAETPIRDHAVMAGTSAHDGPSRERDATLMGCTHARNLLPEEGFEP